MTISELSVRRPVTITMVYALICVIAVVFIPRIAVALYPSITRPVLSVSATYENVGPEEIEENVTELLVKQLTRVSGLKNVTSISSSGRSRIILEFGYDVDIDEAMDDVESRVANSARQLPDDCDTPTVFKFDSDSAPFMRLAVQGNLPLNELKILAEDTVEPLLERIDGVASADVMGGAAREIHVAVSPNRLEALNIAASDITSALAARNIQTSAGTLTQNGVDYEIVASEYYASLQEIRDTPLISHDDGSVTYISDAAEVYDAYETSSRRVYINGEPGLYIALSKETDANVSTISKDVHNNLDYINGLLPDGVNLVVLSDDTTMINSTMSQVYTSAVQGVILAMAIIFIFLRSVKSSIIIGASIPISILITLMVMAIMDLTANIMTMSGLILALGMTVDSSIVILENIQTYRLRGEKPAVAAILGSRNMLNAIIASTLTTICVFIPMIIYKTELEQLGQMFEELVITVVIALVSSLFVAVTLVPALCGSILRLDTRTQKPLRNKSLRSIDAAVDKALRKLENGYVKTLEFALHNRFLILSLTMTLFLLSALSFASMGMNLSPRSQTDDQVTISVTLPIGANSDVVLERLFEFQDIIINEINGAYQTIVINCGTGNSGEIQINLPSIEKQILTPADVRARLTPYLKQWPDAVVTFSAGRGMSSSGIDIELKSNNQEAVMETADAIVALLEERAFQLTDITTDLENGSPQYNIAVNKELAGYYGVSVASVASVLRTAVTGTVATAFRTAGDEIDVLVLFDESELSAADDILAIPISTPRGIVPLGAIASLEEKRAPQSIRKENREQINHITANLADDAVATEAQAFVEKLITENIVLPQDVKLSYAGEAADIAQFGGNFIIIVILAVFLVFAVMAAQFESLIDPFIIFISIPLLAIGVVAVYKITGAIFSLYSVIGVIALVGIVVNNGIVLVDYINQLVRKKTPVFDACLIAARSRLQPILMTTLTTVLGMTPMGFFPGEGGESMQPIGMTIVGGLISGSILTLYVSPIMYSLLNKRREKNFDNPDSLINQLSRPLPDD